MNDSNVDAPIRSPAAANTVLGCSVRSWSTAPASTAAPASVLFAEIRPWKSLIPRICTSVGPAGAAMVIGTSASVPVVTPVTVSTCSPAGSPAGNTKLTDALPYSSKTAVP